MLLTHHDCLHTKLITLTLLHCSDRQTDRHNYRCFSKNNSNILRHTSAEICLAGHKKIAWGKVSRSKTFVLVLSSAVNLAVWLESQPCDHDQMEPVSNQFVPAYLQLSTLIRQWTVDTDCTHEWQCPCFNSYWTRSLVTPANFVLTLSRSYIQHPLVLLGLLNVALPARYHGTCHASQSAGIPSHTNTRLCHAVLHQKLIIFYER